MWDLAFSRDPAFIRTQVSKPRRLLETRQLFGTQCLTEVLRQSSTSFSFASCSRAIAICRSSSACISLADFCRGPCGLHQSVTLIYAHYANSMLAYISRSHLSMLAVNSMHNEPITLIYAHYVKSVSVTLIYARHVNSMHMSLSEILPSTYNNFSHKTQLFSLRCASVFSVVYINCTCWIYQSKHHRRALPSQTINCFTR